MSTKASEGYAEAQEAEQVPCRLCGVAFVPGGTRTPLPARVCCWCYFRGRGELFRRFVALEKALKACQYAEQGVD